MDTLYIQYSTQSNPHSLVRRHHRRLVPAAGLLLGGGVLVLVQVAVAQRVDHERVGVQVHLVGGRNHHAGDLRCSSERK